MKTKIGFQRRNIRGRKAERSVAKERSRRKPANAELKKQRSTLERIIDSAREPIFSVDRQYCYTSFNKAHASVMKAIYGRAIEIGGSLLDYMTVNEDREKAKRNLDRALDGESFVEEAYSGEEARSRLYFEVSHGPITAKGGAIIGVAAFVKDITERKLVEEKLRQSVERYYSLFDRILDGIYRSTHEGRFLDVNPAFVKMFGYSSKQELLDITDIKKELYFSPEERGSHLLDTGREEVEVYRMRRKDGSGIWVEDHGHYVHDDRGNVIYHEGMLRDVTERERMAEELRLHNERLEELVSERTKKLSESERRFRELADMLPETVFELDANGRLTFLNQTEVRAIGYDEEDLKRGLNAFQVIAPENHEALKENIRRIMNGGPSPGYEYVILRKDGSRFPGIAFASPIIKEGRAVGLRGVVVDITERKGLEERLAEAKRLAAIGETATMVGHDLRNPLQAMTGALYLANKLVGSENVEDRREVVELLSTLNEQLHYMDKIISDLQDYARPVGIEPAETSLADLIRATATNARIPGNVEVNVDVQGEVCRVMLDPALFRRVLTNLTVNAVQAMPQGGKLTITAAKQGESLSVTVQDTGVGIDQENLDRIFNPFFTTKAKGQGLGLAVCKRLIEAQGGTITVKSKPGEGSTFAFKIPVSRTRGAT